MVETGVDGINNECDESLDRDRRSSLYQCQAPFSLSHSLPSFDLCVRHSQPERKQQLLSFHETGITMIGTLILIGQLPAISSSRPLTLPYTSFTRLRGGPTVLMSIMSNKIHQMQIRVVQSYRSPVHPRTLYPRQSLVPEQRLLAFFGLFVV